MNRYNIERPLRVFEAFAGYGSQSMALERVKNYDPTFAFELIGFAEIDEPAIRAYRAIHGDVKNYGDICNINWEEVPDFDFFTMSSPCQDFSNAGLQRGGEEGSGTRSSLLWECRRAIVAKRPKFVFFENVKGLVGKNFRKYFLKWQLELEEYGYQNFYRVINATEFGVPQNRERIYMISVLRTENEEEPTYSFPKPFQLEVFLEDVLEEHVDERYFISDKMLKYFRRVSQDESHCHRFKPKRILPAAYAAGTGAKRGGGQQNIAFAIRTAPGQRVDDNFLELTDEH